MVARDRRRLATGLQSHRTHHARNWLLRKLIASQYKQTNEQTKQKQNKHTPKKQTQLPKDDSMDRHFHRLWGRQSATLRRSKIRERKIHDRRSKISDRKDLWCKIIDLWSKVDEKKKETLRYRPESQNVVNAVEEQLRWLFIYLDIPSLQESDWWNSAHIVTFFTPFFRRVYTYID